MDDTIPRSILIVRCVVILLLVLLGGFFAASETAFSYCNKVRLKKRAEEGDERAERVGRVLAQFDKALSTLLIGTNVCYVLANTLAAAMFIRLLGGVGAAVSTAVMTVLIFILAETIPKNIARVNSDEAACLLAGPVRVFMAVLTPISLIFAGLAKAVTALLPKKKELPSITEDEFQTIVENIEDEGLLRHEESELIKSAIEFSDIVAQDVMMPLDKMVGLEIGASFEEIKALVLEEKYSRLPVYAGTPDRVVGILQTRDCLVSILHGEDVDVSAVMNLPCFVKPETPVDELFQILTQRRVHMAIVTGEDGTALGFLTMEDIMEELVGEIYDEDDVVQRPSAGKEGQK